MLKEFIEERIFEEGMKNTTLFRNLVRKVAYKKAKGDPEKVHELALETLNKYEYVLKEISNEFQFPKLSVKLNEKEITPFGTAAGLDKNAQALNPLSYIFGFQEIGTITLQSREGNPKPRVTADEKNKDLYNAQGFPSKGLNYVKKKLEEYRKEGGKAVILANICGIPPEDKSLKVALDEIEIITNDLERTVDGFVWNPYSPNTAALKMLRTKESFEEHAKLIKNVAWKKPVLVKMGPYEEDQKEEWINLIDTWMNNEGDGIVAVNTYTTPKEKVPSLNWGYPSAGRSGKYLQEYRQRAIKETRKKYPKAIIIATGGIDSAEQAFSSFDLGADLLEGYTPYTFNGFGLIKEMGKGLEKIILEKGFSSLQSFLEYNAKRD